jgi:S-adenosylmethionine-diacylglycerol 3-amino-3-carboxypropyl transferase
MATGVEMSAGADAWALRAASLPLAFAQVREDPRLDLELARRVPSGGTVVMIASGGETTGCLGRLPLRLELVDMNPAQLALARVKWELAGKWPAEDAAALLGHLPMVAEERRRRMKDLLEALGLDEDVFGAPEWIAERGVDQGGRYEVCFAELRARLEPWRGELEAMLRSEAAVMDFGGTWLDEAFAGVMSLENLVCLFGQEATQNPRRSFSDHFAERTREVIGRMPPIENPFLWQILAGGFPPDCRYDWLEDERPIIAEAVWRQGKMDAVLYSMAAESAELVHLSNILDWLSPGEAEATLRSARRVLKPGGTVILRQLNSTLEMEEIDSGIAWDGELGKAMVARDRSYFYPRIHVGSRA